MTQTILTHELKNGLVLVAEPMDWLESVAFSVLLPAGCSRDPIDRAGLSNFTCEMVQRGAGDRNGRQWVDALENLGVDRASSVSNVHTSFAGAMPAPNVLDALPIYADLLRRPLLPADQLEEAFHVCLQEVRAMADDPAQKAMIHVRSQHYADPWGRSSQGTESSLAKITIDDIRRHLDQSYRPNGSILSVAGKLDWPALRDCVESVLGDWEPLTPADISEVPPKGNYLHVPHESSQTHIALAYDSVPYRHPEYFQARGAVGVLSDGMSSRLFTEVRERRGLCYTVYATMHSLWDRGAVFCYAGTSTERAQETLEVMLSELARLAQGINQDELERLKARVKSGLIMQQESSRTRTGSIAADWYFLGRVRTLEEIGRIINELSCERINAHLAQYPPRNFSIVTLGARELEVPVGVS